MNREIEYKIILDLFIPLNIDTLSSYLTPILAQYNIQYNDFILVFLNEYKLFLGEYFKYILVSDLIKESSTLSLYNLKIRVQMILFDLNLNSIPKYQLIFKPLILNHIFLYYFKTNYRKKRTLEILNFLKIGSFFWWNKDFNLFKISKISYQMLKWYISIKIYGFKRISPVLKITGNELYTNRLLLQKLVNIKYVWFFNQNFNIKTYYLNYYKWFKQNSIFYLFYSLKNLIWEKKKVFFSNIWSKKVNHLKLKKKI